MLSFISSSALPKRTLFIVLNLVPLLCLLDSQVHAAGIYSDEYGGEFVPPTPQYEHVNMFGPVVKRHYHHTRTPMVYKHGHESHHYKSQQQNPLTIDMAWKGWKPMMTEKPMNDYPEEEHHPVRQYSHLPPKATSKMYYRRYHQNTDPSLIKINPSYDSNFDVFNHDDHEPIEIGGGPPPPPPQSSPSIADMYRDMKTKKAFKKAYKKAYKANKKHPQMLTFPTYEQKEPCEGEKYEMEPEYHGEHQEHPYGMEHSSFGDEHNMFGFDSNNYFKK